MDPGHGGIIEGVYQTSGKRSPKWPDGRQLFEGEFNRDIMNRVCAYMDKVGMPYVKVVDTEEDVPLHERSDMINNYFHTISRECVVCSIHANAGGGTGLEVFTSPLNGSDFGIDRVYHQILIVYSYSV